MKYRNAVLKYGALSALAVSPAFAATDYSSITSGVDWASVSTAIISVFAAAAAVLVAFTGGKFLLRAIRSV